MRVARAILAIVAFAACTFGGATADVPLPPAQAVTSPLPALPTDPAIAAAVAQIGPDGLRAIDTRLVAFGTRSTFSQRAGSRRGVIAARDWIAAAFRAIAAHSGGRMTVALDSYVQPADGKALQRDTPISSVIATLHGDESGSRTYVISSHFDSRNSDNRDGARDAPGADDNGSGTAAVLEAARVLAPLALHATVVFATFDAEEQGLFGSAHYAAALKAAGVDVAGDLNNDIIGASRGPGGEVNEHRVRIFSQALTAGADAQRTNALGDENDSPSRELARTVKAIGDAYVPDLSGILIARADRFLRGGDHESFNAAGFAAIRFTEPVEDFAHQHQDVRVAGGVQYGDLERYVDFAYLARVARYNAAALAVLASGPAAPRNPTIRTTELSNDTTLTWTSVDRATRYEVVRRATTDADWTAVTDVGNVTSATVPFSKDDWLLGVRAVDAQAQRSIVAFPLPRR